MDDYTNALLIGLGVVVVIFSAMALERHFGWKLDFRFLNFSLVMGAYALYVPSGSSTQVGLTLLAACGLVMLPFATRRKMRKNRKSLKPGG